MRAFRIGTVLAQCHGAAWHVTRETWLRVARDETEAELFARQMATDLGAALDASPRVDLFETA
jgi:hypothetical protein